MKEPVRPTPSPRPPGSGQRPGGIE
jgi:hypothetical protein